MSRVASPGVSRFYEAEHARHGVEIRCDARVAAFLPEPVSAANRSTRSTVRSRASEASFVPTSGRNSLPSGFIDQT